MVSANPSSLYARSERYEPYLDTDRTDTAVSLLNAGVSTALHSDTPELLKEVWGSESFWLIRQSACSCGASQS